MATISNDSTDDADDGIAGLSPSSVMVATAALLVVATLGIGAATLLVQDGSGGAAPQAQFDAQYDAASETLTIVHRSGDELDASRVAVRITETGAGTAESGGHLWDGRITPGDAITLRKIGGDEEITVVWEGDDRTILLWTWSGPE